MYWIESRYIEQYDIINQLYFENEIFTKYLRVYF